MFTPNDPISIFLNSYFARPSNDDAEIEGAKIEIDLDFCLFKRKPDNDIDMPSPPLCSAMQMNDEINAIGACISSYSDRCNMLIYHCTAYI